MRIWRCFCVISSSFDRHVRQCVCMAQIALRLLYFSSYFNFNYFIFQEAARNIHINFFYARSEVFKRVDKCKHRVSIFVMCFEFFFYS